MNDSISRQAAMLRVAKVNPMRFKSLDDFHDACVDCLKELPSTDVVEVVRCKDCMNWIPGYITDTDEFIPPKCGKYQQMVGHDWDDFCSLGERKDGKQHE